MGRGGYLTGDEPAAGAAPRKAWMAGVAAAAAVVEMTATVEIAATKKAAAVEAVAAH